MRDEKKTFYLVAGDVLPEAILKTAEIKALLNQNTHLTVNEAVEKIGLSRSAFYKYRDSIFPYEKSIKGRILTLIIVSENDVQILADCLQVLTEADCQVLTINRGMPEKNTAKIVMIIDTQKMRQEIESLLEKLYELPKIKEIEILD